MPLKHILFDAGSLMNQHKSGVGYYTKGLITALAVNNPDVTFNGYYHNFLGRKHVTFDIFPPNVVFKPVRYFPGIVLSPLARILGIQLPIELLVFRKYDLHLFPNFISLPSLRRTPNIIVIHDLGYIPHPEYIQPKNLVYLRRLLPRCVRRATGIFSVSEFTKSEIAHYLKPTAPVTVTLIPPAMNPDDDTHLNERLQQLGVSQDNYFLFLGTIEPRKNLECLIQAYTMLPKDVAANHALVLAGGKGWLDTELLATIEQLQSQGVKVIQTGYVSEQERSALYANARCVVLPAHYEGFGIPALEALVFGTPLLVSDIPPFHEITGDYAQYFDGKDPATLAQLIQDELRTPLDRTARRAYFQQLLQRYNWQNVASTAREAMEKAVRS